MPVMESTEALTGTTTFLAEGDGYMKVVAGAHKRPTVFTTELTFNLLTMAIEKHAMAILMASTPPGPSGPEYTPDRSVMNPIRMTSSET